MINYKALFLENEYLTIIKPVAKSITVKPGENIKAQVVDILPNGGVLLRVKGQLVEVQSEIPLQKGTQLYLRILELSDKNIIKFQLLSQVSSKNKHINTINLFSTIDFKNLINKFNELKPEFKSVIVNNFYSIYDISKFQEAIKNTGILFESKIKKGENFKNDLKFKLLNLLQSEISSEDKKEIRELIKNIQEYQYLSKLTETFWTFIPFLEKDILNSEFIYKKLRKKDFSLHFILIRLNLNKVGEIDLNINLFDKNLFINFFVENKDFLKILRDSIDELKKDIKKEFNIAFAFSQKKLDIEKLIKNNFKTIINLKA